MNRSSRPQLSRRHLLTGSMSLATAAAGSSLFAPPGRAENAAKSGAVPVLQANCTDDGEVLGQGSFRYRAYRHWGDLDRRKYPVRDGHGISGDRHGRIVLLTNDIRNNLLAYGRTGEFMAAWESRFPGAHGFDIVDHQGEDQYWITDQVRQRVSVCDENGRELWHVDANAVASRYPDLSRYIPTNTATLPDGDFFIADGYGSSYIHHFDPKGRYITSFGGEGGGPEHLRVPHAVWIDRRAARPRLLVCDREHNMLKWFSVNGELQRVIELGAMSLDSEPIAASPCNVAAFGGYRNARTDEHIAIACLRGMILILDGADNIVSVVGGEPATYVDGKVASIDVFNHTFNHPHDVHVDAAGSLYVSQWSSNQTYPIKLELMHASPATDS